MKVYRFLIKRIFFVFMLAVIVVACKEEDAGELINEDLTGVTKVYFDPTNAGSAAEASNIISSTDGTSSLVSENTVEIAVVRTGTDFSAEATVSFTATTTYATTTDFFDAGDDASNTVTFSSEGSVTIPANESRGSIVVSIADDVLASGNRTISLTLTSSTVGELGLSESDPQTTQSITITDDDCPVDINSFAGKYNMVGAVRPSDGLDLCGFGTCADEGTMTVDTSDPSGTTLLLELASGFGDPLQLKFITCPQQVELLNATTILGSFGSFSWEQNVEDEGIMYGTYDPESFKIVFWGGLASATNGYEVTLERVPE